MECDDEGVENVLMSEMKHDEECKIKKRKMKIRAMKRQTPWAAISDQSLFKICLFVYQSIGIFISDPIDPHVPICLRLTSHSQLILDPIVADTLAHIRFSLSLY